MLKPSLYDYSHVYIFVKGTISVAAATNKNNKKVIFKKCAPFNDCIAK